jgi:CBS domain-containing protein
MENTIATRIYDFLKEYPPFNLLSRPDLEAISANVRVQFYQPEEMIFQQDEPAGPHFFIVHKGAVHLLRDDEEDRLLIDECDEGDVFGIRPLLAEEPYALSAQAVEETLIYAIPTEGMKNLLDNNPKVSLYLASNFAAGVRNRFSKENKGRIFIERDKLIDATFRLIEVQSLESSKKPVVCQSSSSIQEAARLMSDHNVGSIIIINGQNYPIGIITDKDLRNKVATGKLGLTEAVERIMSSPVITVSPELTVADVQILMVKHQIHHLCVTEDGSTQSPVIGVLSEHDLLVIQGNNPAIMIREVAKSKAPSDLRIIRERAEELLKKYIYQEVSIAFISTIMTEVNDAITKRAIEMAFDQMDEQELKRPAASFCWMALGSLGRGEQLLRTDQDNALVFEDVPETEYEAAREYYLELSNHITRILNQVGFEYCPAEMMASNPKWCKSLKEWKETFSEWIYHPSTEAIMYSTIFFDYRPVFGNTELTTKLTEHIFEAIEEQTIFLSFLGKNALQNPPPLSFFRNFMVEKGGEHKNEFDIKKRAMMPLADAARALILEGKISDVNNTFRRFEKLAEKEPQNEELYESAADAYEVLMRYRTLQGLKHRDSGRFFKPEDLTKMERMNLRNSFRPISEIQSLLTLRFQLDYFR